jgi:hypothetical protein
MADKTKIDPLGARYFKPLQTAEWWADVLFYTSAGGGPVYK